MIVSDSDDVPDFEISQLANELINSGKGTFRVDQADLLCRSSLEYVGSRNTPTKCRYASEIPGLSGLDADETRRFIHTNVRDNEFGSQTRFLIPSDAARDDPRSLSVGSHALSNGLTVRVQRTQTRRG